MGDLLIRDVSDAIKNGLADKARQGGRSLSDEVKLRLSKSLAEDEVGPEGRRNAYEVLRGVFVDADALMTDEEHAEFMRAIEEGRRDFGRPVPDME
jgi:antitoxin FitA